MTAAPTPSAKIVPLAVRSYGKVDAAERELRRLYGALIHDLEFDLRQDRLHIVGREERQRIRRQIRLMRQSLAAIDARREEEEARDD